MIQLYEHNRMAYASASGLSAKIFLMNQKRSAKSGKMSEERKNRLRAVGALGE